MTVPLLFRHPACGPSFTELIPFIAGKDIPQMPVFQRRTGLFHWIPRSKTIGEHKQTFQQHIPPPTAVLLQTRLPARFVVDYNSQMILRGPGRSSL